MAAEVMTRRFASPARGSTIGLLDRGDDEGGTGTLRIKVVLTKKQLRQGAAAMGLGRRSGASTHRLAGGPSLEQLLHSLCRRRQAKGTETRPMQCRSRWRPELQSIPEED